MHVRTVNIYAYLHTVRSVWRSGVQIGLSGLRWLLRAESFQLLLQLPDTLLCLPQLYSKVVSLVAQSGDVHLLYGPPLELLAHIVQRVLRLRRLLVQTHQQLRHSVHNARLLQVLPEVLPSVLRLVLAKLATHAASYNYVIRVNV